VTLLNVDQLHVEYGDSSTPVRAVDGVSFTIESGEIVGLVGESGSGKSTVGFSLMGLLSSGRVTGGSVRFHDQELLSTPEQEFREIRGNRIAMIFQDPMTSLDPSFTIGEQLMEPMREHLGLSKKQARARALDLLALVGIPAPADRMNRYPHEFSGGMRQRVVIAIALACDPELLICDEPTSALDVTVQAQILTLLRQIQEARPTTGILMITHDLGVVAELCDRVAVMYGGQIVEQGTVHDTFATPRHPYTQGLLGSLPSTVKKGERLRPIVGTVPNLRYPPPGCRFQPRCPYAIPACATPPPVLDVNGQSVRCVRALEEVTAHERV
jgi:peptide/nickel transport system ATP-binding protein